MTREEKDDFLTEADDILTDSFERHRNQGEPSTASKENQETSINTKDRTKEEEFNKTRTTDREEACSREGHVIFALHNVLTTS